MSEAILDPAYWKERLDKADQKGLLHQSIYLCHKESWERIERVHRGILADLIKPHDSILDAGCGYGRLLSLLPGDWVGDYVGFDLSPDLIARARVTYRETPRRVFQEVDLGSDHPLTRPLNNKMDWCVLISMRMMIRRNVSGEYWDKIEETLKGLAHNLLFLEYEENDLGEVVK